MNVFVLCTGRCGSTTFIEACHHITNFTSAHESLATKLGDARFAYPENHIEADNRLTYFLGQLDRKYGNNAFYVHLTRNTEGVAKSLLGRYRRGAMRAYSRDILIKVPKDHDRYQACVDYCNMVNTNIEFFLRDKTNKMDFRLETAKDDFREFWNRVGAQGNLDAALGEWDVKHNRTKPPWFLRWLKS